ncbi:helix-turn-helix transcriptional regulator [Flammeovirga sp. EKP202]|uniref:helix-turn-helix transcriptional regulator n=1 Tax=Flammeovirga sp. EKP202 TaxID=2770592 RepID=UPI00165F5CE9|nr:AraC family transcriptional regulator [Flammeovirga sp. EKP202]MBD0404960.1 helix-turn-helix transcriptional regulator [Flammeovirga sp. EKP202]
MLVEITDRNVWLKILAHSLNIDLKEGQERFTFDNEFGKGTFSLFRLEEGVEIRSSNFILKQEILFKEQAAKEKKCLLINFSFHGYPQGTVIVEHPQESLDEEKKVLLYSDNSTIVARFQENEPKIFIQISIDLEWLKANYKDFIDKYSNIDVGLSTQRSYFAKQSYSLQHQKSLEELMFTNYPDEIKKPVYRGLVLIILADILHQLQKSNTALKKHSFSREIQMELDALEEYIKSNLDKEITIEMLCKKIGYSKTKLHHLFKDYFKYSMYDYIKYLKLAKAKALLLTTELAVSEVAIQVGYQSVPHFTNRFKKEFGVTPIQFRKGFDTEIIH